MQALINTDSINQIDVSYMGENTTLNNNVDLDQLLSNWDMSKLSKVKVSEVEEELPPEFLYSITIDAESHEKQTGGKSVFTIISQEGDTINMTYLNPEGKEYRMTGKINVCLKDFLEECLKGAK